MKGCVIIPTFNEAQIIYDLVIKIKDYKLLDVLVVDDGSSDKTDELAKQAGAEVIRHERNLGKGVSLRTGFKNVVGKDYDFVITMDGDGQHHADDLRNFISYFETNNTDIIVGNRMDDPKNMPLHRFLTNKVMSMIISSICKVYIADTQCGFRLIRASALRDMVFSTSNYEIESELLIQASKKKYTIASMPIKTIYEGQESDINPFVDTVRFFKFILKDQLREGFFAIKELLNDTLVKHVSVIFLASIFSNVFNLLYWLFMVRMLDHVDYGVLNSVVSFLTISSLPTSILNTVLVRHFSEFNALEEQKKIQALFRASLKRILSINIIFILIFIFFTKHIAIFLNLDSSTLIYLSGLFIFFSNISILTIGTMQGIQLFNRIALNSLFQAISKIFFGVLFVIMNFKALGGLLGFCFSTLCGFILSVFQLPPWIFKMKRAEYLDLKINLKLKEIYGYFLPVSVALISYTLFTNIDVVLVKHFFSNSDAGIYSIVQTVGKILLFLPSSLVFVLFPVSIQHKVQNKNMLPILKKSLLFISFISLIAITFTFTFPGFVLRIISGKILPDCIPLVRLIIFPMSLFALDSIFIYYNLSANNLRFIISVFIISLLQIVLIILFHKTLLEIILILFACSLLVFYLGIKSILSIKIAVNRCT